MRNPVTVIGGIVALVLIAFTSVVVLAISGEGISQSAKTVIITGMMTSIFTAIPSILAILKSENVQHDLRNGVVKNKVKDAVAELIADPDSPLTIQAPTEEGDSNGRQGV